MGNPGEEARDRTQSRKLPSANLARVNEAAKRSRQTRFTAVLHHVDVAESGVYADTVEGTPQGAGISPLLANIFFYYVLDLWVEQWRRRQSTGHVRLVR